MLASDEGFIKKVKEKNKKLNAKQKEIAKYILDNYSEICFMSAPQIGMRLNTSQSTILRLSNALGYESFYNMQRDLQNIMKGKITQDSYLSQVKENNFNNKKGKKFGLDNLFIQNIQNDLDNINYLPKNISINTVSEITESILSAKNIFIMGFRSSASLANILGHGLNLILDNVRILNNTKCDVFDQILRINKKDILIGFCFARYTRETVDIFKYAKSKGTRSIAFTDDILTPFSDSCDIVVPFRVKSIGYIGSQVGPLCIINFILALSVIRGGKKALNKLKVFEKSLDKYKVFYTKD